MQTVSIIVAMDRERGIGIDGRIPWRLPADLAHFKQVTMGRPVIMGRATYESIGRPLPGRRNIVLSRNPVFRAPGCELAYSLEDGLRMAGEGEVFVIGGAGVYAEALAIANRIYMTRVDGLFAVDTHFPDFDLAEWHIVNEESALADERNPFACQFVTLKRNLA